MILLKIALVCTFVLCTNALQENKNRVKRDTPKKRCGGGGADKDDSDGDKVVPGNEAKPGDFPFVVSIHQEGREERTQYCAGSIVDKNYILTAARCAYAINKKNLVKLNESEVYVVAGDFDLKAEDKNEQKVKAKKFIFPETWDENNRTDDIMLIELESPGITLKKKVITAIDWNEEGKPQPGTNGHIIGWGTYQHNPEKKSDKLRVLDYVTVDNDCADKSKNAFCAAVPGLLTGAGSICDGDEGGPYLCGERSEKKNMICGIASRPTMPNNCYRAAVYTDVCAFDEWITETIKQ